VHHCVSEDIWFLTMLDIDAGTPPLPIEEVRLEFIRQYADDSEKRLVMLGNKDEGRWEGETTFRRAAVAGLGDVNVPEVHW
jgi:hypothetical protein